MMLGLADRGQRTVTRMGKTAQDGPFTPIVKLVRNQLGTKEFNQLRGKGISLHSQGMPQLRLQMVLPSITKQAGISL